MKASRYLPLLGLVAVGLIVVAIAVVGDGPGNDASAAKIAAFYRDNDSSVAASGILMMAAAAAFLGWAIQVRGLLAGAEGGVATRTAVGLVGSVFFGAGMTLFAGLSATLGDVPERLSPASIQALHVLSEDMYPMLAVGALLVLLGYGLAILATHAFPAWLGWVAIVGAIGIFTPAWFVPFIAVAVLMVVTSVLMVMQRGTATVGVPPAPAPAA